MPRFKIGAVLHISNSGNIIVQGGKIPPLGATIVTKRNVNVGFVKDIFGPVENAFVSVSPRNFSEALETLVGKTLFYTSFRTKSMRSKGRTLKQRSHRSRNNKRLRKNKPNLSPTK